MIEDLFSSAMSSQGFTVAAFLVAIVALWSSLRDANTARIAALEAAVKDCMEKHDKCENRNRDLSAALVDLMEDRRPQALAKCRALLSE